MIMLRRVTITTTRRCPTSHASHRHYIPASIFRIHSFHSSIRQQQQQQQPDRTTPNTTATIDDSSSAAPVFTEEDYAVDHSKTETSPQMRDLFKQVHKLGELTAKAQTLLRLSRYHPALACYLEILDIQPNNLSARINVATIHHHHLHQYKKAMEQYEIIVEQMREQELRLEQDVKEHEKELRQQHQQEQEERDQALRHLYSEYQFQKQHQQSMLNRTLYQLAECCHRVGQSEKAMEYCDRILDAMVLSSSSSSSDVNLNDIDQDFIQNVKQLKQSIVIE